MLLSGGKQFWAQNDFFTFFSEAVAKQPFPVDAIVPIASKEMFSFNFDAMETIASRGFA